jgi:PTS system mannose-specific IIB component
MIVQIRIDDRLIHGQVALMWSKALDTKGIIVANDAAAEDETISATLKMACPSSQHLLVKGIEESKRVINDPRSKGMRILVLTNCVADALTLVEGCPGQITEINMANVGRFNGAAAAEKTKVATSVELTSDELKAARDLCDTDVHVYHQVTPNDAKTDIPAALKGLSA